MRSALNAAGQNTPSPNPPVGAAVVLDGVIVGVGHHERLGAPHAEVAALQAAGALSRGATLYVTLEPCNHLGRTPPCTDAILRAGVARVVYAVHDPNPNVAGGGAARLAAEGVVVERGFGDLQALAEAQLAPWTTFITLGRPRVTLKLAMSIDGRIATRGGESRWITSAEARADGHALRAANDAILVGSGTVLADDPALTVRHAQVRRPPTRVVFDGAGRLDPSLRVFDTGAAPTVLLTAAGRDLRAFIDRGVQAHEVTLDSSGHVDVPSALRLLASRGIVSALCEGGGRLHGALVDAGAVDQVVAYVAPTLLGGDEATMATRGLGALSLSDALRLRWTDLRRVGDDLRLEATR